MTDKKTEKAQTDVATQKQDALATVQPPRYPIVSADDGHEIMTSAFETMGIGTFDLQRVKIPSGGMQLWTVRTIRGEENPKTIECVIALVRSRQKSWWRSKYGTGAVAPPDCSSEDSLNGYGVITMDPAEQPDQHPCLPCPWNQFGSKRGTMAGVEVKGKDCRDYAQLFMFMPGSYLPTLFTVPVSGLKELKAYVMLLADQGRRITSVVTSIGLVKDQNDGGIEYSKPTFTWVSDLSPEQALRMKAAGQILDGNLAVRKLHAEAAEVG